MKENFNGNSSQRNEEQNSVESLMIFQKLESEVMLLEQCDDFLEIVYGRIFLFLFVLEISIEDFKGFFKVSFIYFISNLNNFHKLITKINIFPK